MADGSGIERHKRDRLWIKAGEWAAIERAAKRLAGAFGYGSGWRVVTIDVPKANAGETGIDRGAMMGIAHCGRVTEQAARTIDGSRHVRWRSGALPDCIIPTR